MPTVLSALCSIIFLMAIAGCVGSQTDFATTNRTFRILGEAEFSEDPAIRGRFDDVFVTWLEPAHLPRHAADTGIAGEDHLPIVVTRDETRMFSMEDANGLPNTMKLLDAGGTVMAETGVGQPPVIVKLKAGDYTLVIHRASNVTDSDNMVAFIMPLQRVEAAVPKAVASYTTTVNSQITDAVTQANVKVLGDAPAIALGNLYQATAQALANAAHNATSAQQQAAITFQAATTMGVNVLYSIDTATTAIATAKIFQ